MWRKVKLRHRFILLATVFCEEQTVAVVSVIAGANALGSGGQHGNAGWSTRCSVQAGNLAIVWLYICSSVGKLPFVTNQCLENNGQEDAVPRS